MVDRLGARGHHRVVSGGGGGSACASGDPLSAYRRLRPFACCRGGQVCHRAERLSHAADGGSPPQARPRTCLRDDGCRHWQCRNPALAVRLLAARGWRRAHAVLAAVVVFDGGKALLMIGRSRAGTSGRPARRRTDARGDFRPWRSPYGIVFSAHSLGNVAGVSLRDVAFDRLHSCRAASPAGIASLLAADFLGLRPAAPPPGPAPLDRS